MATNYNQLATNQYDQTYMSKVQDLKNQLASQVASLDGQKTGINYNYDTQVNNQNLNSLNSKNNFSDQMLNRGLGRSSVVTTGLGEMDQTNNRIVNNINTQRVGDLNGIEAQKSTLQNNLSTTLNNMAGERLNAIQTLARQLEDRDFDKNMQLKDFALKQQAEANNQANALRSYNLQVAAAKASQKAALARTTASNQKTKDAQNMQDKQVMAQLKNDLYDTMNNPKLTPEQKNAKLEKEKYMLGSYFNDSSYAKQASDIIGNYGSSLQGYYMAKMLNEQKRQAQHDLPSTLNTQKKSNTLDNLIGNPNSTDWILNPLMSKLGGY